jgi:hypothetical protein
MKSDSTVKEGIETGPHKALQCRRTFWSKWRSHPSRVRKKYVKNVMEGSGVMAVMVPVGGGAANRGGSSLDEFSEVGKSGVSTHGTWISEEQCHFPLKGIRIPWRNG